MQRLIFPGVYIEKGERAKVKGVFKGPGDGGFSNQGKKAVEVSGIKRVPPSRGDGLP